MRRQRRRRVRDVDHLEVAIAPPDLPGWSLQCRALEDINLPRPHCNLREKGKRGEGREKKESERKGGR